MERPHISPTLNYGALLQTITVLVTIGTLVWFQAVSTTESRVTANVVNELKPAVEASTKANIEQNAQLQALSSTLTQLRADQAAVLGKLTVISEDVITLKARVAR